MRVSCSCDRSEGLCRQWQGRLRPVPRRRDAGVDAKAGLDRAVAYGDYHDHHLNPRPLDRMADVPGFSEAAPTPRSLGHHLSAAPTSITE